MPRVAVLATAMSARRPTSYLGSVPSGPRARTMRRLRRWRRERARDRRSRQEIRSRQKMSPRGVRYVYTRRARRIALETVATLLAGGLLAMAPAGVQSEGGPWSPPALVSPCSSIGAPTIPFPSDRPTHGTGPGAVVWGASAACAGGAGVRISAIAPSTDAPEAARIPRAGGGRALALGGPAAAGAAPGQILLAGRGAAGADSGLALSEGPARGGSFSAPLATGGRSTPLALTDAYLGDVALASPGPSRNSGGGAIELRVHRYYMRTFAPAVPITGARSLESLTLAMDYRSDALAVWERDGQIYARFMPGSDRSEHAAVRVAFAEPGARIAATLSDDNRAILAWSETRDAITSVYAELSSTGVRFGAPRLLERFADPGGLAPPNGSPRLVRLLSESVMLAWTGASDGHWVVHTAAVDLNGVRTIETISPPGGDALLADLAPGPKGEAYALWSEPGPGGSGPRPGGSGLDLRDQALYSARGIDAYPGRTIFGRPELVTAPGTPGSSGEAAIAVDPDTDRPLAAWRTSSGAIYYSLRALGGA